jgi:hypothetical protein
MFGMISRVAAEWFAKAEVTTIGRTLLATKLSSFLTGAAGMLGLTWLLGSSSHEQVRNYRR